MTDRPVIHELVGKLRRAFPRHREVLHLCSLTEELLVELSRGPVMEDGMARVFDMHNPPKRDRAAYMREYRKRAKRWNEGRGWTETNVSKSA